uniref:Uncharacterized protein n=1 Tax=Phaeomonas parva TaxID=124430 RepID=A0A7S1U7F5_9STRA|mmetsp:Transcript_35202/g.110830  ORF Transcript_35202/g.110830 Transcript_35202/m.110830 type:complete len:100 (+) Transcript_35202:215-514(+)|eukprot:CAMPEP_0118887898 /NCGR_PEP_ID=MMETSP1163-20130328/25438_1 /TAXON_ID=124430 /ORGANISM="Phaeomonas parva, Strain CCMP2877" /LENGTH=99 /DNA_ID=CAMNT_0006826439 /DNA_START=58 /DNA_END=357 /DNA_ORIENTATION=+
MNAARGGAMAARALRARAATSTKVQRRGFFDNIYKTKNSILEESKQINDLHNHNFMHYKRGQPDIILNYVIYGLCGLGSLMATKGIFYEMANGYGKKPI